MILFTNGCSYTWGSGLKFNNNDERLRLVWPHHLGNKLNASKVINLAIGCGSNQRIIRTTYDWFFNEYNGNENVIAFIQMTDPSRYEFYDTDDFHDLSNDPYKWVKVKANAVVRGYNAEFDAATIRKTQERFCFFTKIEEIYSQIRDCAALSHLSSIFPVKFYFYGFSAYDQHDIKQNQILQSLNYNNIFHSFDKVSATDPHLSVSGHKQMAEYLYNEIIVPSTNP
jgi:hypothetical protein